eukprot:CAMPEP_0179117496 /NCGR_PEP_ID=MMETSP0796-20121207/55191_1 /TAXON_ID=73915 /ORGANISM="Pyrodinium bahamense, Strain pbaha01" /LENGTH=143 /DNA_ID=CAMNT_0020815871 /DNA_START=203 /DNA_END=631 /DNA_ORIENTATION=+
MLQAAESADRQPPYACAAAQLQSTQKKAASSTHSSSHASLQQVDRTWVHTMLQQTTSAQPGVALAVLQAFGAAAGPHARSRIGVGAHSTMALFLQTSSQPTLQQKGSTLQMSLQNDARQVRVDRTVPCARATGRVLADECQGR